MVAVWLGGRVLAVRQPYRSNLSWPGGGIRRGEAPREAARRELREELGLLVGPDDLVFAREMVADWDFRRDHVRVFEVHLRAEPDLRVDNREIVAARFVEPRALLAERILPPFIRAHLGGAPRVARLRPPEPDPTRRREPRPGDRHRRWLGSATRGAADQKSTRADAPAGGDGRLSAAWPARRPRPRPGRCR